MLNLNAPQYIKDVVKKFDSKEVINIIEESYGDEITVFEVDKKLARLDASWDEEYEDYAGEILGIDKDGKEILLFDILKHGYNGLFDLYEEDEEFTRKIVELDKDTRVLIAFQYNEDEEEYVEDVEGSKAEDFFQWIAIFFLKGEELILFSDFECA